MQFLINKSFPLGDPPGKFWTYERPFATKSELIIPLTDKKVKAKKGVTGEIHLSVHYTYVQRPNQPANGRYDGLSSHARWNNRLHGSGFPSSFLLSPLPLLFVLTICYRLCFTLRSVQAPSTGIDTIRKSWDAVHYAKKTIGGVTLAIGGVCLPFPTPWVLYQAKVRQRTELFILLLLCRQQYILLIMSKKKKKKQIIIRSSYVRILSRVFEAKAQYLVELATQLTPLSKAISSPDVAKTISLTEVQCVGFPILKTGAFIVHSLTNYFPFNRSKNFWRYVRT